MLFDKVMQSDFECGREACFRDYHTTADEYLNGQFWKACVDKKDNPYLFLL